MDVIYDIISSMITVRQAVEALESAPIIAAVKARESAAAAAASQVAVVFVLGGSIMKMDGILSELARGGKMVFLHMDLIEGIGRDEAGMAYAAEHWKPAGVITTRTPLVKAAREHGLLAVQRIFLLDSASIRSGIQLISQCSPDFVEVMPGVIPKAIGQFRGAGRPVIAGGMVTERGEVIEALSAGALAVSTSSRELWDE
jgi:glycerol uptake operon antiterminator